MTVFRKLSLLIIITVIFLGCSNDDIKPGCFQEDNRKILATTRNIEGTISQQCLENFIIIPNEKINNQLAPLSLQDQMIISGLKE